MSIAIRRLDESARAALVCHFLTLPALDRYLRFANTVKPEIIARYVDAIDFERDAVFAVDGAETADGCRPSLAGVVHAAFPDGVAELGVSVLPAYRRRGLASSLTRRAMAYAWSRGVRRLSMQLLAANAPMVRIARRLGMTIFNRGTDLLAQLDLPARRIAPRRRSLFATDRN